MRPVGWLVWSRLWFGVKRKRRWKLGHRNEAVREGRGRSIRKKGKRRKSEKEDDEYEKKC